MINTICLDKNYSTTRLLTKEKPIVINNPEDKFESMLFLPEDEGRKGEGGLRTKGYLKKSYEDKPLISIVTVVFNGEEFLEETILSVINQTYDNVEYIIIDGGSTDATVDIIKKYEDKIDYWVSEKDAGIYDAMNKGIDVACGKYLFFLGADDFLFENIIEDIFHDIQKDYSLIYGNVLYNTGLLIKSKYSFKTYLHNTIHHQAAFYNRNLFNTFRYDIKYQITADYELNLIIFLYDRKNSIYLDKIVSVCTEDGISRTEIDKAHNEMKKIRCKYTAPILNTIFDILLAIKLTLIKLRLYK